jgi:hypothetical protein
MSKQTFTRKFLTMIAAALALATPVFAKQHLVRPGDDWAKLAPKLSAGDELILMPGRQRPAALEGLQGSEQRPIVIRGVSAQSPATIFADRYGLELRRCQHVIVQDLIISGATIAGVLVNDDRKQPVAEADNAAEARHTSAARWPAHVTIRRVTIERTGPDGSRDALHLADVELIKVEQCEFAGWGGAAVAVVACANVSIAESRFKALEHHGQHAGIQIRAGSEAVSVNRCRFDRCGEYGVIVGGASGLGEFRPPLPAAEETAKTGPFFEAQQIEVDRCTFNGIACPLALLHCTQVQLRNNLLWQPTAAVLSFSSPQEDARLSRAGRAWFSNNVIVGDLCALPAIAAVQAPADVSQFEMGENLWWCDKPCPESGPCSAVVQAAPGQSSTLQLTDIDPKLNSALHVTAPQAEGFGPDAP